MTLILSGRPVVLDRFSYGFYRLIIENYPEWHQFAREHDGALILEVPSPLSDCPLVVTTYDQEITVFFGEWHEHFNSASYKRCFADTLKLIEAIIQEQLVFVEWQDPSGQVIRSTRISAQEDPEIIPETRMISRSWRGKHDRS